MLFKNKKPVMKLCIFGCLLFGTAIGSSSKLRPRIDDICGAYDGRRIYLELSGEGILEAKNSTGLASKFTSTHRQCSLELITCPSCLITVKFLSLNISRNCGKTSVLDSCGCDYVWVYEPPFEDASGEQFCNHFANTNASQLVYKSQTRAISINFLFSSFHDHAFTLQYSSERNRQFFDGYANKYSLNNTSNQYVTSPFFPHFYPHDMNTEYVITCRNQASTCRIRLIFTDFQLSTSSLIEFFDYNSQRLSVSTGTAFRPPLITTSGPKMVIRFYANGGTNLGFRASYNFFMGEHDSTMTPGTDCGGYVDSLGGAITMMNMVKEHTKAYDCFWIIRPPSNFLLPKTQIYLKIITFADFAGPTELTVRQGTTSKEPVMETLRHPSSSFILAKQREHVVPIEQGFYISLRGLFRTESRLAIVYSAFNYKACYSGSDYLCRNMRCIQSYLVCDGFDHCGDNSDETTACLKEPNNRLYWTHVPNFFFPKTDKYSSLKMATIVFVLCSLGLMSLIIALVFILYRLNMRNRTRHHLHSHLQTINDMLDDDVTESVVEEIHELDEPPVYEAPPDYENIIKLSKVQKPRSRSTSRTRRLHASATTTVPQCLTTTPPPVYSSLSRMEASEIGAEMSQSSQLLPSTGHSLRRRLSLDKIRSPIRACNDKEVGANPGDAMLKRKPKMKFSSISETQLLLALISFDDVDFENEAGVKTLRRSASTENLSAT